MNGVAVGRNLDSGSRSGSKVFKNWNITPEKGFNEMFLVST